MYHSPQEERQIGETIRTLRVVVDKDYPTVFGQKGRLLRLAVGSASNLAGLFSAGDNVAYTASSNPIHQSTKMSY